MAKSSDEVIPDDLDGIVELVEISKLKQHPRNPNIGDAGMISELIKTNSWFGVVTVSRDTKHIVDGNHRVQAAEMLGIEKLPVYWRDLTPEQEIDILLSANQAARLAYNDQQLLSELLQERATAGKLLGTGFDEEGLNNLLEDIRRADEALGSFLPDEIGDPEKAKESGDLPASSPNYALAFASVEERDDFVRIVRQVQGLFGAESITQTVILALQEAQRKHA